jgi:hypothetical protein
MITSLQSAGLRSTTDKYHKIIFMNETIQLKLNSIMKEHGKCINQLLKAIQRTSPLTVLFCSAASSSSSELCDSSESVQSQTYKAQSKNT